VACADQATGEPLQVTDNKNEEQLTSFGRQATIGRAGQPTELAPA
jgi:hypothetical protein